MTLRRIAAAALALTGLIHLVLAPEYLGEQAYVGVLFIAGGVTCLGLGAWLWARDDARAWALGALVCAGMFAGFVLSRTTGLPGFKESEWELSGIVTLICEAAVIALAAVALRAPRRRPAAAARGGRRAQPALD